MTNPFLETASRVRSLNRALIIDLPGIKVDEGILGKSGLELISGMFLRQHLAALAPTLDLDPQDPDLIRQFDGCFDDPRRQAHALEIARSYGRRLGYLLLMLRRGDAVNRDARPEWSADHWAFWQSVKHVCLGGGIVSGNLGRHAIRAARDLLIEHGVNDLTIEISPYALYLPLVGLARAAPADTDQMLLLDFGQTSIKRGIAGYQGDQVTKLQLLSSLPAVCGDVFQFEYTLEEIHRRWRQMLEVIEESWSYASPSSALGISLACHLSGGRPLQTGD
jgi:hypothetical protein